MLIPLSLTNLLTQSMWLNIGITGLAIDSRQVKQGNLFVALVGERVDGHDFIEVALKAGAVCVLTEQAVPPTATNRSGQEFTEQEFTKDNNDSAVYIVQVPDTKQALFTIARFWRREIFTGTVIAVTGSNGKTTIKNMLQSVFQQCYQVYATKGNNNNELGVALSLLNTDANADFCIIEMGARKTGDIAFLCELALPHITLISNIGQSHLGIFKSLKELVATKAEIYQSLTHRVDVAKEGQTEKPTIAVLDQDNPHFDYFHSIIEPYQAFIQPILISQQGSNHKISEHVESDFSSAYNELDTPKCKFKSKHNQLQSQVCWQWADSHSVFYTDEGEFSVNLPLVGKHNTHNAAFVVAIARQYALTNQQIATGLEQTLVEPRRLQFIQLTQQITLIDDSYNASPQSTEAALSVLAQQSGSKVMVFGSMLELGDDAVEYHQQIGRLCQQYALSALFCLGELASRATDTFTGYTRCSTDCDQLTTWLIEYLRNRPNLQASNKLVTVLLKGSNGMNLSIVSSALQSAFELD